MFRRYVTILALAGLLGCASERYTYAPVRTTSAEVGGEPAAIYAIPSDSPRGDVRLATFGIAPLRPQGVEDSTLQAIHVALVVSNRSDEPWTVDGAEQQLALAGRGGRDRLSPTTLLVMRSPRIEIPARSTRRIDLFFPLPAGLQNAREVPAFEVIWTVRIGSRTVTERTPFQRFLVEPLAPSSSDLMKPEGLPGNQLQVPGTEPPNRHPSPLPAP